MACLLSTTVKKLYAAICINYQVSHKQSVLHLPLSESILAAALDFCKFLNCSVVALWLLISLLLLLFIFSNFCPSIHLNTNILFGLLFRLSRIWIKYSVEPFLKINFHVHSLHYTVNSAAEESVEIFEWSLINIDSSALCLCSGGRAAVWAGSEGRQWPSKLTCWDAVYLGNIRSTGIMWSFRRRLRMCCAASFSTCCRGSTVDHGKLASIDLQ